MQSTLVVTQHGCEAALGPGPLQLESSALLLAGLLLAGLFCSGEASSMFQLSWGNAVFGGERKYSRSQRGAGLYI